MRTVSHSDASPRLIDTANRAELERRFPELATPLPHPSDGWRQAMPTAADVQDPLPGMPAPAPVELAAVYARQVADLDALVRAEDQRQRSYARVMLDALAELRGALDQLAAGGAR